MDSLEQLKVQDQALTERLNGISDRLANNNLDSVSKSALVTQHEEAWHERQEIRRNIQELEDNKKRSSRVCYQCRKIVKKSV